MSKPTMDRRRKLAVAGMSSGDPLDIINVFYSWDGEYPGQDVRGDYWMTMVCVLAERIVAAERGLKVLRIENFRLNQESNAECKHDWRADDELATCAKCGKTDSLDVIGLEP